MNFYQQQSELTLRLSIALGFFFIYAAELVFGHNSSFEAM